MTKEEEFIEALKSNINVDRKSFPVVFQATVVDVGNNTCKIKTIDNDLELEDVQFSATEGNDNGFILIPKQGTNVLVGLIGDDENSLYLVSIDEIDAVKTTIGDQTFLITENGFELEMSSGKLTLKNNISDLKVILSDIVSMVSQITVSTGVGPSGTPLPPTVAQAQTLNTNINALFN
jgi:hypothetical protein